MFGLIKVGRWKQIPRTSQSRVLSREPPTSFYKGTERFALAGVQSWLASTVPPKVSARGHANLFNVIPKGIDALLDYQGAVLVQPCDFPILGLL